MIGVGLADATFETRYMLQIVPKDMVAGSILAGEKDVKKGALSKVGLAGHFRISKTIIVASILYAVLHIYNTL